MNQLSNMPAIGRHKGTAEKWVRFGSRNVFPEFLRALVDNCPPLMLALNRMAWFIAGNGVEFHDENGEVFAGSEDQWRELMGEEGEREFLDRTAADLCLMGSRSWELILNGFAEPGLLGHLDTMRVRSEELDDDGYPGGFWWSDDWTKARSDKKFKPVPLNAYRPDKLVEKAVMYRKGYHNGSDVYGIPWWMAALTQGEVLSKIPVFNRTQIDGGFRPAFHIHVFNEGSKKRIKQLDERIEATFTGEDGKLYALTYGTVEEGAPQFNPLPRGDHAGELSQLEEKDEAMIYKAVGIPRILLGAETKTGLGGQGLAIEQTLAMFMRTVIIPLQNKFILEGALNVMRQCSGFENIAKAVMKQVDPFDSVVDPVIQRQTYMRRTTVNEDRVANGLDPLPDSDPRGEMFLIEINPGVSDDAEEEKEEA